MNLALFDFDGTLTTKDSLAEFIKYAVGTKRYIYGMITFSPVFVLYKLKIIRNDIAKEKLFSHFFKDIDENRFKEIAKEFSINKLDLIIREDRLNILKEHQNNGDKVIIVSASMKCWLQPWCDKNNIELLSTQLKFVDNKFTGKFFTRNCYGDEKANRINNHLNIADFDTIYAYGDSSGDNQMLNLAHKSVKY